MICHDNRYFVGITVLFLGVLFWLAKEDEKVKTHSKKMLSNKIIAYLEATAGDWDETVLRAMIEESKLR